MEPKPHEWHRKPPDCRGNCPTCNCSGTRLGEHRRVDDPQADLPLFLKRIRSGAGWNLVVIDSASTPKKKRKPPKKARTRKRTPKPTTWHRRPAKSDGPCAICGWSEVNDKQHRRVDDPGAPSPRFVVRDNTPVSRSRDAMFVKVSKRTRERICAAVELRVLGGKTTSEIAEELGVTTHRVHEWTHDYPGLWDTIEGELMENIIAMVRAEAGTDAVLNDPDGYFRRASVADKWVRSQGNELFPAGDATTLTSFYESYYLPVRLADATENTKITYKSALDRWRLTTGDPPLEAITVEVLAKFRDHLKRSRGRYSWKRMSDNTIAKILMHVQAILDKAGPSGPRNRDAAGVIEKAPWIRRPRTEPKPVVVVDPDTLNAVYAAAVGMTQPRIGGVKPSAWWRALLVITYNSGLRRSTLQKLRWEWVNWQGRTIAIPPTAVKSKRSHTSPLNETSLEHLRTIQAAHRELLFPWNMASRLFYGHWHKLLDLAGIPRDQHFGLHDLRKTLATRLWESNPAAAQLALGHADSAVTSRHYVSQGRIVAAAIDALPQPSSFTGVYA